MSKGCPGTSARTKTFPGSQEEWQAAGASVESFPPNPQREVVQQVWKRL